jgi:hypothetical protein
MSMKFTQITNVKFFQVMADAELKGTFFSEAEAYTRAAEILESTGNAAIVYTMTHESVRVER